MLHIKDMEIQTEKNYINKNILLIFLYYIYIVYLYIFEIICLSN